MDKKKGYSYTYSAREQAEVKRIRDKYTEQREDKMQQLIRLDASVTKKGTVISVMFGILGTLVMGTGMSCIMVWGDELFVSGIIIGIIGVMLICIAYPAYVIVTKKEKQRLASKIVQLADELLK